MWSNDKLICKIVSFSTTCLYLHDVFIEMYMAKLETNNMCSKSDDLKVVFITVRMKILKWSN